MSRGAWATLAFLAVGALANGACSGDSSDGNGGGASNQGSSGAGGQGVSSAGTSSAGASSVTAGQGPTPTAGSGAGGAPVTGDKEPVGSFTVHLEAKRALTSVVGLVRDAPAIDATNYVPDKKSGACQLYKAEVPFCATPCTTTQVCASGGTCVARPTNLSVGKVTVKGVATEDGSDEFSMDPVGASKSYSSGATKLKYPPAAPGAEVRLSATGADSAPFEIVTHGVGPIQGFSEDPLPLNRDQPLDLTWTAEAGSEIDVVLEIAHHGGARGKVICSAMDTGSISIPAELVTALIDLGVAGFPDVVLTRKSVGSAPNAPRMQFIVFADVVRSLSIEGLTSCLSDADCPEGQTCGQDKACAN